MAKVVTKSTSTGKENNTPVLKTESVSEPSEMTKETKKKVSKTVQPKVDETKVELQSKVVEPKVEVQPKVVEPKVEDVKDTKEESKEVTTSTQVEDSEESGIETLFNKLVNQFQDLQVIMKTVQTNLKVLQKEVLKERKENAKKAEKSAKKTKGKRTLSGFAKSGPISTELADFLEVTHDTQLSRTEVTSRVIKYVKDHSLQNPAAKKEIIPDAKLGALLSNGTTTVSFFNLQTFMKKHFFSNAAVAPAVAAQVV
jgi:chromatin remodeling complex protein RSC6